MDPQLLDYYNQELTYMREAAGEFADLHPKIARRLGLQGVEVADPYVERLIESFCFMSARMRIKLDADGEFEAEGLREREFPALPSHQPRHAELVSASIVPHSLGLPGRYSRAARAKSPCRDLRKDGP